MFERRVLTPRLESNCVVGGTSLLRFQMRVLGVVRGLVILDSARWRSHYCVAADIEPHGGIVAASLPLHWKM